jgi:hypothetical protein
MHLTCALLIAMHNIPDPSTLSAIIEKGSIAVLDGLSSVTVKNSVAHLT